jgi:predicted HicB family RNase H-like nuclease
MLNTKCECTLRSTPSLYRISEPEKRQSRWSWRKKAAAAAAKKKKKSLNATTTQLLCLSLEELFFVWVSPLHCMWYSNT